MSGYSGYLDYQNNATDFDAHTFLVEMMLNRIATTALVQVVKVTSAGEVAAVGFVDVQPMVNQVDSDNNPTEHGVIHNVPYFRIQGGTNAIILDPVVNDIGIAVFCSRDISRVKRRKFVSNPGSSRKMDWSDALFIGGVLNGIPEQFVQFSASGIAVTSPTKITITAPSAEIDASVVINGTVSINGNVATTGTLANNSHDVGSTHHHINSGGTGIGGVPV